MNNVRKNIIIEKALWEQVARYTAGRNLSISSFIQQAVKNALENERRIKKRLESHQQILLLREKITNKLTTAEILEFKNAGRK